MNRSEQSQGPSSILVIDDTPQNLVIARDLLEELYTVKLAPNGALGLKIAKSTLPDLILLDVVMPDMDGYEVCKRLKADPATRDIPVIFLTAQSDVYSEERGFELGAMDYVSKPIIPMILLARVKAQLQLRKAADELRHQAMVIQAQAEQLEKWNKTLETRVDQQVVQLDKLGHLKRFFSPQLADLIMSEGEEILRTHRREVSVVLVDLRGFTFFTDQGEPEEVVSMLDQFHAVMGKIILEYRGTLERFAGDSIMIFFNDPVPMDNHAEQAVRMALDMQAAFKTLAQEWNRLGYALGMGCGIALGYATLGKIGFEGRWDYAAIGSVVNLASRLCDEASDGEILLDSKANARVGCKFDIEPKGPMALKGFTKMVRVFSVTGHQLASGNLHNVLPQQNSQLHPG